MSDHQCNKEDVLAKLEVHADYHSLMLEKIDKKTDKLASKDELKLHRYIIAGLFAIDLAIVTYILGV